MIIIITSLMAPGTILIHSQKSTGLKENQLNTGRNTGLYADVIAHGPLTSWNHRPVTARTSCPEYAVNNRPVSACAASVCACAERKLLSYEIHQETEKVLQFDVLVQLQL